MNRLHTLPAALVLAAATVLVPGCGDSTATITGEVTYDGKPVEDGYITFTPADGRGKDAGGQITNGQYKVEGVPPGPKVARVTAVKKVNFASSSEEMMQRAAVARRSGNHDGLVDPADIIPENAEGNNARVELRPGTQEQNFHLTKPGGGKGG
jgi:hypothetical protein